MPAELLSPTLAAEQTAVFNAVRDIVVNIRRDAQKGIVWPSDRDDKGNQLYTLKLLSTGGTRQFDTGKIIDR